MPRPTPTNNKVHNVKDGAIREEASTGKAVSQHHRMAIGAKVDGMHNPFGVGDTSKKPTTKDRC